MAVILAYGSPSLGHLFPIGALLRELARRGHQVHLRTMVAEVTSMRKVGAFSPTRWTRGLRPSPGRIG